jgi:hypothetical protein
MEQRLDEGFPPEVGRTQNIAFNLAHEIGHGASSTG